MATTTTRTTTAGGRTTTIRTTTTRTTTGGRTTITRSTTTSSSGTTDKKTGVNFGQIGEMQKRIKAFKAALQSKMAKKISITNQNSDLMGKAMRGAGIQEKYAQKEKELEKVINTIVARLDTAHDLLGKIKDQYEDKIKTAASSAFK